MHLSVDGPFDYFYILAVVGNSAVSIGIFFKYYIYPRGELLGHLVVPLSFLRNLHSDFHSGYTNLHSHQHCIGFLFLHVLTRFVTCGLLIIANLEGVR